MTEYVQFIIPIVGDYPTPVDPENPTAPEQTLIDEWQARKDNADALYGKIERAEDWLLDGRYEDIINQNKYVEVAHAASPDVNGAAHWFPLDRIIGKDGYAGGASQWVTDKVATLRLTYELRGWVVDDPHDNLATRGYTIVDAGG